jgi:hypothetical protein
MKHRAKIPKPCVTRCAHAQRRVSPQFSRVSARGSKLLTRFWKVHFAMIAARYLTKAGQSIAERIVCVARSGRELALRSRAKSAPRLYVERAVGKRGCKLRVER